MNNNKAFAQAIWRGIASTNPQELRNRIANGTMTQQIWDSLSHVQRQEVRDNSDLQPKLIGLEGCRCEITFEDGSKRRFIVGKTTGWRPAHLFMRASNQRGSSILGHDFGPIKSVRVIERVR